MFLDLNRYPRKPLTPEQERENRAHNARTGMAQSEYESGKEALRDRLAEKYKVEWEAELEGDWEVVGRFNPPHVAPVDEDALTPDQRVSWENDKQMAEMLMKHYSTPILNAMTARFFNKEIPPEAGRTVRFRRV